MSKINPGSNFNEDNDVRTARPGGMQEVDIIEPKIDDNGKFHCSICDRVFSSREDYISHFLSKHQTSNLPVAGELLRTVPYNVGFHFFISEGHYMGETAVSLVTFAKEVEVVPIESIEFHFKRADFQKWLADTITDKKLATEIGDIEKELSGEPLRLNLLRILNARVKELENQIL